MKKIQTVTMTVAIRLLKAGAIIWRNGNCSYFITSDGNKVRLASKALTNLLRDGVIEHVPGSTLLQKTWRWKAEPKKTERTICNFVPKIRGYCD